MSSQSSSPATISPGNPTSPPAKSPSGVQSTLASQTITAQSTSTANPSGTLPELLSDLGSSDSGSDTDDPKENSGNLDEYQTMNEKKRLKRNKRKFKETPGKEEFLKKPNLVISPTNPAEKPYKLD